MFKLSEYNTYNKNGVKKNLKGPVFLETERWVNDPVFIKG